MRGIKSQVAGKKTGPLLKNEGIMISEIELLKKSDIFAVSEDTDLKRICKIMEKRIFHEGEKLAVEGEKARFFFLLISGTILLSMENGKSVVMDKSGDFIGFEVLSYRGIYKSSLTALTKGEIFAVNRNSLLEMIQEDSPAALSITHAWHDYRIRKIPFAGQQQYSITDYQY